MTGQWYLYVALLIRTIIYVAMTQLIDEINGKKVADIYWNSSNTLFTSDNTNQVFTVHILDRVDIICPKYSRTVPEEFVEYSAIYMVTKDGYDKCSLDSSGVSQIVTTCRKPYSDDTFALVFREFTPNPNQLEFVPGRDYYFISTSNGSNSGLWNREGGLCLHKNMRLHFSVKERRKSSYNEYKVTQALNNNYNGNYVSQQRGVDFIYDSSLDSSNVINNRIGYSSTRHHHSSGINSNDNNNVPIRTPFNRRVEQQYHSTGQQAQIDYRIDPSGQSTDRSGQLTDRSGHSSTDPNGQRVNKNGQLVINHRTADVVNSDKQVVPGAQNAVPPQQSSSSTPEKWPWWHFQNAYAYVSFPPDSGKVHEQTPSPIRSSAKSNFFSNSCMIHYYSYLIVIIIIVKIILIP